jgi:glc operon protein GlcG
MWIDNATMFTLDEANRVIGAALNYAREHGYRVSVSVCDSFGHLIAHQRMDGASSETGHYSIGKAVASAGFGIASGEESTAELRTLPVALAVGSGVPLSRRRGGIPVIKNGKVAGGIGVSGAPSNEEDEHCARHGVEAVGFSAKPPSNNGSPAIK